MKNSYLVVFCALIFALNLNAQFTHPMLFEVNSPSNIQGSYNYGPQLGLGWGITALPTPTVTGPLVWGYDITPDSLVCDTITNNYTGKIVMIRRGVCNFAQKMYYAQQAGAIGCIICNNQGGNTVINMATGTYGAQVTIPSVSLSENDCALLAAELAAGNPINASFRKQSINNPVGYYQFETPLSQIRPLSGMNVEVTNIGTTLQNLTTTLKITAPNGAITTLNQNVNNLPSDSTVKVTFSSSYTPTLVGDYTMVFKSTLSNDSIVKSFKIGPTLFTMDEQSSISNIGLTDAEFAASNYRFDLGNIYTTGSNISTASSAAFSLQNSSQYLGKVFQIYLYQLPANFNGSETDYSTFSLVAIGNDTIGVNDTASNALISKPLYNVNTFTQGIDLQSNTKYLLVVFHTGTGSIAQSPKFNYSGNTKTLDAYSTTVHSDRLYMGGFSGNPKPIIRLNICTPPSSTITTTNCNATVTTNGGTAPYTYIWSNGATGSSVNGLLNGSYSLIVTDQSGCAATNSFVLNNSACSSTPITACNNRIAPALLNGISSAPLNLPTQSAVLGVQAIGFPNVEYLVVKKSRCALNETLTSCDTIGGGGDLLLGADDDGVFIPANMSRYGIGVNAGDTIGVLAFAYDLNQVRTVFNQLLTGIISGTTNPCCAIFNLNQSTVGFCDSLNNNGISSSNDINNLSDVLTIFDLLGREQLSVNSFISKLQQLNNYTSVISSTGCGTATDGVLMCYGINPTQIYSYSIGSVVNPNTVITDTVCSRYNFNGQWLSQSGTYYAVYPQTNGPDSIVQLDLAVFNATQFTSNVSFVGNITAGTTPLTVIFENQTPNRSDYNFTWSFGDGSLLGNNGQFVPHTYNSNGTWNVALIAQYLQYSGCVDTIYRNNYIFTTGGTSCGHSSIINQSSPISGCANNLMLSCNSNSSYSYQWMFNGFPISGANNNNYYPQQSGNYSVVVTNNNCPITSNSVSVTLTSAPTPIITSNGTIVPCIGGTIILDAGAGYNSYVWSNGSIGQTTSINSSGNYTVSVTSTNGCSGTSQPFVVNASVANTPNICIVGVGTTIGSSNYNRIIWEKPNVAGIDSFFVYKETNAAGVYSKIGSNSYQDTAIFVDVLSNTAVQAYRYKITLLDSCGIESAFSDFHKTIHLTINQGVGTNWNLIWSHYEGVNFLSYNIYRGSNPNNMTLLTTIASNLNSYTDINAPSGQLYYQIEVILPYSCNPLKTSVYNGTRSNIVYNQETGIVAQEDENNIVVYPNPTSSMLTLEQIGYQSNLVVEVFDLLGRNLQTVKLEAAQKFQIELPYPQGMYYISVVDDQGRKRSFAIVKTQ